MSDGDVAAALRSGVPLVVIEAPAGCGKTHQGAEYARELSQSRDCDRALIVTHTHAACSVFVDRTKAPNRKADIRTIDSVIATIAGAYHLGLNLPADIGAWVRQQPDDSGHALLAQKVGALVERYPMIAAAIAGRHPVIICDEHQDSSGDQHAIVMALLRQGARVRIFADPMQRIFNGKDLPGSSPQWDWDHLWAEADRREALEFPHRWKDGCPELGEWTLRARECLRNGMPIDLTEAGPEGLQILGAENCAPRYPAYSLSAQDRKPVDRMVKDQSSLLILTRYNKTARSFRSFFNRRVPLWEGHSRTALEKLVQEVDASTGDCERLAQAIVGFMAEVGKGFSPSAFGDALVDEARTGCAGMRKAKRATIQSMAKRIVDDPNHRGVANALSRLDDLRKSDAVFSAIEIDHNDEFYDAMRLKEFESAAEGLAGIMHRRTYSRPRPPSKAISTIHKAKGLECDNVIVMPCDAATFPDRADSRCLLYVALSRAKKRLLLVVSRENPTPLLKV